MKLKARFYRAYPMDLNARHPALGQLGSAEKELEVDEKKTMIIGMHLWNVGEPNGPQILPDHPDWKITKLYDFYPDALKILQEKMLG